MESENYDSSFICDHYLCGMWYPTAALQFVHVMIAFLHSANACLSYDGIADLAGVFVGNTLGAFVEIFVGDLVGGFVVGLCVLSFKQLGSTVYLHAYRTPAYVQCTSTSKNGMQSNYFQNFWHSLSMLLHLIKMILQQPSNCHIRFYYFTC